jgi:glycosyltransferase involved in cell wall biosynthesis
MVRTITPRLSICLPSRNRQKYLKQAIIDILKHDRDDFQLVIADNSTDPGIMNDFIQPYLNDPRVCFLPSQPTTLSMVDNWERCVKSTTGDWVCIIGDDDYLDPDVIDIISRIETSYADADVVSWTRIAFNWPEQRPYHANIVLQLGNGIHKVDRDYLHRAMFYWEGGAAIPNCPFCLYHGAVSRRALNALLTRYGEPLFQYPTMDYENTIKLQFVAKGFVYVDRPFSVLGVCPESNSASTGNVAETRQRYRAFLNEIGRDLDADPEMRGFPFSGELGVTAAIAQVQQWYKSKYNYMITNWETSFAKACARNCLFARDITEFKLIEEGYRAAFKIWDGGRHEPHFNPVWHEPNPNKSGLFTGYDDLKLFIDETIANVQTPQEAYSVISDIAVPADMLELKFEPDRQTIRR